MMSRHAAQDVRLPQPCKRGPARWIVPLVVGFATFLIGVTIGSAGSGSDVGNCAELAEEYQALVSEGIDAGMSMDEAWVAQVADRRDQLAEVMEVECG